MTLIKVRESLGTLPQGPLNDAEVPRVIELLASIWGTLKGHNQRQMTSTKLLRDEDVVWKPPVVSFTIERHGGIVGGGSTRAELQRWHVDLSRSVADLDASSGRRQVAPQARGIKVEPIATELAKCIAAGTKDPRLKWQKSGAVRILVDEVFPSEFRQTTRGRARRLRASLSVILSVHGWRELRSNLWGRTDNSVKQ